MTAGRHSPTIFKLAIVVREEGGGCLFMMARGGLLAKLLPLKMIEGENADTKTPKTLCTLGIEASRVPLPSHLRRSHAR